MRDRRPVGLPYVAASAGEPLARLAGIEGLTRAVMVGTVPLAAFEAFGSKQAVSVVFFLGSLLTVLVTLNIGRLEQRFARRWVLTTGVALVFVAAVLFAFGPPWMIAVGISLQSTHASMFSVCLSLYVMDFIGKADLVNVESRRSVYLAAAWLVGPTLGVWAWSNLGHTVPFLMAMVFAVVVVAYHWYLRLDANPILLGPTHAVPSPLTTIPKFFRNRNLRIAYVLTCTRSVFWAALFVYGPIYVIEAGFPAWAAGAFLSIASSVLFLGPIVRRLADRHGVRSVIQNAFFLIAASMAALMLLGDAEKIGVVFWLTGAVGGGAIDVLGNIPFMRLVKPRQRGEMTSVFATWREVSFLIAPGLAALVLLIGPFWLLYGVIAVLMLGGAAATTFLPRRL